MSLAAFVFGGCHPHHDNEQLANIESMQNDNQNGALDSLLSIDYDNLSEKDKHYYDFLKIKISDKNYIQHESDSLIMAVVKYETDHPGNGRYPEALYYAGRVYSDLGDYPRALSYFQQALDANSVEKQNLNLKGRIESQQGQLLIRMGLFGESVPHIKESLSISRLTMDTINIMHGIQLLGFAHIKIGKLEKALDYFKEALTIADKRYDYHAAKSRMYMALIKYKQQQLDSAQFYINNTVDKVHPVVRNHALSIAADIYLEVEMTDSAYKLARELILSNDSMAKETGYNILLDSKLSSRVSHDSLWTYINIYHKLLNARFNRNSISYALNQQNLYNYQTHVHEKEISEKNNRSLKNTVMWLLLLLMAMIGIILYFRNRYTTRIIKLQQALSNIKNLKTEIERNNSIKPLLQNTVKGNNENRERGYTETIPNSTKRIIPMERELRKRLQDELMQLYENSTEEAVVSYKILQSDIYRIFKESINNLKMVNDSDPRWLELEKIVLEASPQFLNNMLLLANGRLTSAEIHTALLIKCGFRPVDMQTILGKSNGAIISRRESISLKVLDQKMEAKVITNIIRLL